MPKTPETLRRGIITTEKLIELTEQKLVILRKMVKALQQELDRIERNSR